MRAKPEVRHTAAMRRWRVACGWAPSRRASRARGITAALALAVAPSSGFVCNATHDGFGVSYDELTTMIADAEARRSSAIVRDQTYVSAAGTLLCMLESDKAGAAPIWAVIGICLVPLDVVVDVLGYDAEWLRHHAAR